MQRTYRGKRVDTKEWVYGFAVSNETGDKWYIIESVDTESYGEDETTLFAPMWYEVIPETVGQYTGLKDKKDKEVYIDDIVNCLEVTDTRSDEYISEVFEEECEVLVHDSRTSDTPIEIFFPHPNQIPLTEIEVIGNIYDNPELYRR